MTAARKTRSKSPSPKRTTSPTRDVKATKAKSTRSRKPVLHDDTARFERLLKRVGKRNERFRLRLFVTGTTQRSIEAVQAIRSLCEEFLTDRYDLEIVDVYQQPGAAASEQIIAAPTLVKSFPLPVKRIIGNLADREKVIVGLNLARADGEKVAGKTTWVKL